MESKAAKYATDRWLLASLFLIDIWEQTPNHSSIWYILALWIAMCIVSRIADNLTN